MSSPFLAEIRIFAFAFAPTGWAQCNGQLLPISQNTALFSLLGTYYGGDGKSTFALPNLQNSVAIGQGQGPGLSDYVLGQPGGSDTITLITTEMPLHNHQLMAQNFVGSDNVPTVNDYSRGATANFNAYKAPPGAMANMAGQAIAPAGGSQPHNNMMPSLAVTFCIAMQGVFPPRN
jgi:microcystin-dependent protein